ncbi:hypothetical protein ABZ904_43950 [Streptomyces sp. NPDC046900]|uniref:hypothetical protein n=1 Tax=Streptomyces sp. NPDC046900 TaxID=3155473 RepID=UPI0033E14357
MGQNSTAQRGSRFSRRRQDALPFSSTYVVSDDLGPVVEAFLADSKPGIVAWSDLDDVEGHLEQTETKPEITPLRVWASSVGASH